MFNMDCDFAHNFLKNLVKRFVIGPSAVQVAGVTFTDKVHYEFDFKTSVDDLLMEIDKMACVKGQTMISTGLKKAESFLENSRRPMADNVVLLLSDGNTQESDYSETIDIVEV